ncbi:MAG: 1-acyl-sn-glycerol-3-phosphate acyltransferase, partial [Terriglobia bacterium]
WLRLLIKVFLRVAFRVYYRSIHVRGMEHFPKEGPVLLVANHPNSLLDPAILVHLLPRPVHFGAKHTLFAGPMRLILGAFGAIPLVRAQDERGAMRRNFEAFERYAALLRDGGVTAIFPEGVSQDDPHLAPVKPGAARIALQAESAANFRLGLAIVPVGLQFEPRRRFRADALVRFGEPFRIADLAARHAEAPRQAVRELTERIGTALKRVAFHVESTQRLALVERLVEVYFQKARRTGIAGVRRRGLRAELLYRTAACLNHYLEADPAAVTEVQRALECYERLREKAGIDRRLLEEPSRLLPGPLAPVQAAVEALVGAIPALSGFATGAIPYYVTKAVARRYASRLRHLPSLSFAHILVGAIVFPLTYGLELGWVWWHFSDAVTIAFAILLVPTGLFARFYTHRMRKLAAHLGGRIATWMKLAAVVRVRLARDDLLLRLDHMRDRYRMEVLGWGPLPSARSVVPPRVLLGALLLAVLIPLALFLAQLRDRPVVDLPEAPSLWHELRSGDPAVVTARLERDARGAAAAIAELNRLEQRMYVLRESFVQRERSYYAQEDADAIHRLLLTYLNLRTALLRTVWTYRGAHDEPLKGHMEDGAFLLAYASAAVLLEKAAVIVDTFSDDERAQRRLNEGDRAWEIREGTYDRLLASLSNAEVVSELQAATKRFDQLRQSGAYRSGPSWETLVDAAAHARPAIEHAAAQIGERKLQLALRGVRRQVADPVYGAQALVSTWIGDFRLKERPPHRGLISPPQVKDLREVLQPGDILLERRNWFLSNAFLPGFWPHSALYLGDAEALEALGVAGDPRVMSHWDA